MSGSGWAQDKGAVVAAWNSLRALAPQTLAAQFAADPARVEAMTRHIGWPVAPGSAAEAGMRIDFSKTHLGEAELAAFEALAEAAGKGNRAAQQSSFVVYPDAPHAFHADYRPSYRKEPAEDGFRRAVEWFRSHGLS